MFSFYRFAMLLILAVPILTNCGKTEHTGSAAVVDTVRVVVRDTIYIKTENRVVVRDTVYIRTENVAELPDNFSYLSVVPRKFAAGINIEVDYLSSLGARLFTDACHTWKTPDEITVTIKNLRGVVLYETTSATYRPFTNGVYQSGQRIFIPKSDIPTIYPDYSEHRYPTRVAIRYGERTYTN